MVAVQLHNGLLLPARFVKEAESGQWSLGASGGGHHVVAIDRKGNEHYVVKHDILTMEQADELALVLMDMGSCDEATLEYLIEQVNKKVYSSPVLKYFRSFDVSIGVVSDDEDVDTNYISARFLAHWVPCDDTGGFYAYDAVPEN